MPRAEEDIRAGCSFQFLDVCVDDLFAEHVEVEVVLWYVTRRKKRKKERKGGRTVRLGNTKQGREDVTDFVVAYIARHKTQPSVPDTMKACALKEKRNTERLLDLLSRSEEAKINKRRDGGSGDGGPSELVDELEGEEDEVDPDGAMEMQRER